jgi:FtsH-binding integral membrane protein
MDVNEYAQQIQVYSLDELRDIENQIDQEQYPERHRMVLARIAELEGHPAKKPHGITTVQARTYDAWYGQETSKEPAAKKDFSLSDGAGVFLRDSVEAGARLISPRAYNGLLGVVLVYGFLVNYLMVTLIPTELFTNIGMLPFLLLYFGSCFLGIRLFVKSENPWVSFAGYNFVVVPFGAIVNMVLSLYDLGDIQSALAITGLVTACMLVAGTLLPKFFVKIERLLFLALLFVVVVELIQWFLGVPVGKPQDIVVALIFCGYIAVDWGRANRIPKTADNAVDSAAALYMDIIHLFLRIVRAMGKRRR